MTIKGLRQFLKKRFPQALETVHISYFRGRRIAVDAYNWIYKNMHGPYKTVVMESEFDSEFRIQIDRSKLMGALLINFTRFIMRLMRHGVIPVFIFDGDAPADKGVCYARKTEKRRKEAEQLEELRLRLVSDPFDSKLLSQYRDKHANKVRFEESELRMLYEYVRSLGFPNFLAKGEGEQLASMLAIEGYVEAAYTTDTDTLAYGCPITIYDFDGPDRETCKIMRLSNILWVLGNSVVPGYAMAFNTLQDICIAAQCDYNTNLPNLAIGRAFDQLAQCGRIEDMKLNEKQIAALPALKVDRCRELFSYVPCKDLLRAGSLYFGEIGIEARNYMTLIGLESVLEEYATLRSQMTTCLVRKPRPPHVFAWEVEVMQDVVSTVIITAPTPTPSASTGTVEILAKALSELDLL